MKNLLLTTALALTLTGCLFDSDDKESSKPSNLYFVGSDYSTGALYQLDQADTSVAELLTISQDSKLIETSKGLVVLERTNADNILLFNTESNTVIYQEALEAGANASDLVELDDEAFVSLYGTAKVLKIDLASGDSLAELDLSGYALEGASTPNANDLEIHDGKLYASLQRLDANFQPGLTWILEIDPSDLSVLDTLVTEGKNINQFFFEDDKIIALFDGTTVYDAEWNATSGNDGYVASIELSSAKETVLLSEEDASAKPKEIIIADNQWYITTSATFGSRPIFEFDQTSGDLNQIEGITDASGGIHVLNSNLIVGDRAFDAEALKWIGDEEIVSIEGDFLAPYSVQVVD